MLCCGCEENFWGDQVELDQTPIITIKPSSGDVYEYNIYTEYYTLMEWATSSSVNSNNRIYSYIDNSSKADSGDATYSIEFVESRYDSSNVESQYYYQIVGSTSSSVNLTVTNLTTNSTVTNTTATLTRESANVSSTDIEQIDYNPAQSISITERNVTLAKGEEHTLQVLVGDKAASGSSVKWSSDNESVATVSSSGVVQAIDEGSANINICSNDGNYRAISTISVVIKMETITISPSEDQELIIAGDNIDESLSSFTVSVDNFTPSDATISATEWVSTEPTIASVDESGVVTALTAGVAYIYATSTDGSEVESNRCKVTIAAPTPVTSVTIAGDDEISVERGLTHNLSATVLPDEATNLAVKWESKDPTIASVDDSGVVTAVKAGSVKITATAKDGSLMSDEVTVNVIVSITNIDITGAITQLEILKSYTDLGVTLTPSDTTQDEYKWSSSNPEYATIDEDSGDISALTAGTTTITVTSKSNPDIKDTFELEIRNQIVPVTSVVIIDEDKVVDYATSQSVSITAPTVSPDTADDKTVKWSSSDDTIATVDSNGVVTAKKAGGVTITATANDGSGKSDSCDVTFFDITMPTTLEALKDECTVSVTTQMSLTTKEIGKSSITDEKWTSETTDVATIDISSGVLTAVTTGTTKVTYSAKVGGVDVSRDCEVTVLVKSFPDTTFASLLKGLASGITLNTDGTITLTEANQTALNTITTMVAANTAQVTNMTGVEYLTNLSSFTGGANLKATSIDFTKNKNLTVISWAGVQSASSAACPIQEVKVAGLSGLKTLLLTYHSNITSIDLSGCTGITTLKLINCSISTLDISKMSSLTGGNFNCTPQVDSTDRTTQKTLTVTWSQTQSETSAFTSKVKDGMETVTAKD